MTRISLRDVTATTVKRTSHSAVTLCDDCHLDVHREQKVREVEEVGEDYLLFGDL